MTLGDASMISNHIRFEGYPGMPHFQIDRQASFENHPRSSDERVSSRDRTTFALAATTLLLLVCIGKDCQAAAPSVLPNVVVIMTDDQGYGEFSCHGNPVTETKEIDRLASQSVRLTDFHVAPMCTPTRGQFLSGLDAFRNHAINVSSGRTLLDAQLDTIADVFQEGGYRTGMFGKWHLGDNYPFRPEDRGFGETLWFPSSHINSVPDFWDNDYFDDTYIHNGKREKYSGYCTDLFFDEAIHWIQESDNKKPFFAFIPLNSAHFPWFVPDHYRRKFENAVRTHPELFSKFADNPKRMHDLISFLAMGSNIDDNVGKLTRFLDESGNSNNTIVIFMTDNGSTFGQDYFNAGMKGKKTQLWEGGHRVPCFIRWPSQLEPRDVDQLCHVQDLMPTLAELTGIQSGLPADLDGQSLVADLHGNASTLDDRMLVINYSRMPMFKVGYTKDNPAIPHRDGAAVLWKNWRLLENRALYDVSKDPHQDHDVAMKHPDVVARMRSHLLKWWGEVEDNVMDPQRVIIGDDAENPMLLTACEWLDVFVDQQIQIRVGQPKNGVWHLNVAQPGRYEFELRRWPRESGLDLDASVEATRVTDGQFLPGKPLPITGARMKIGEFDATQMADSTGQSITFQTELKTGETELQTWMQKEDGEAICGAYYVYVRRIPSADSGSNSD